MLHHFPELCVPSKIVAARAGDKPRMTSEVRTLFRQDKRLHKRSDRNVTGLPEHYVQFREIKPKQHFVKLVIHFVPTYQIIN